MIGVDITKISRFSEDRLDSYNSKFGTKYTNIKDVAKFWACYESIVKAEGKSFPYNSIEINFPSNEAPKVKNTKNVLSGEYFLTLSHEDDMIVAIAFRK